MRLSKRIPVAFRSPFTWCLGIASSCGGLYCVGGIKDGIGRDTLPSFPSRSAGSKQSTRPFPCSELLSDLPDASVCLSPSFSMCVIWRACTLWLPKSRPLSLILVVSGVVDGDGRASSALNPSSGAQNMPPFWPCLLYTLQ
ncbi:hypothetical protein EJ06DRAFT_6117 [Trichodelitschia bisporula]|uniref:Uncharacterized protein n=1 Tax=Trichodelitschia bisporula TaxID=703511 RepID=A0A6G1I9I7_9PEZI|nr:hypothetical protein EJ06DRAFT_6117 [Trichodelitschia bisporula]